MPAQIGQEAPDFTLFTADRQAWTLSEHCGRAVEPLFFPGAFTLVGTDQLVRMSLDLESYEALGARMVGISIDAPAVLKKYARVNDRRRRATLVIGGEGALRHAEVLQDAEKLPNYEAIKQTLIELREPTTGLATV